MICIKCDKCKGEIKDTQRIYNVTLLEREAAEPTTDENILYSIDAGLYAATKRHLVFQICGPCFNKYLSEIQEGLDL